MRNHFTDFLVAGPTFLQGAARTLDIWGCLDGYNASPTGADADVIAIRNDWRIVGDSIHDSMKELIGTA